MPAFRNWKKRSSCCLFRAIRKMIRMLSLKFVAEREATRPPFLPATSIACISNTAKSKAGKSPCQVAAKVRRADIKKLFSPLAVRKHMVRSNMNRAYIVFSVYPVLKLRDVYTPQQLPWLCSPKQTSLMLKLMKVKLSGILSVREVPAARM